MRSFKSYWYVAASSAVLIAALTVSSAADKKDKDEKEQAKPRPTQPQKSQSKPAQPAKTAPQQGRKVETPQVSAPQAHESQPAKAQPEPSEKREAPQTSDQRLQPKLEKTATEKGQVQQVQGHPEHPEHPDHPTHPVHPAKPSPEKGQARDDHHAKSQPEKVKAQPDKSQAHLDHPTPPPANKEQQVHARQPVTTLKPEQTVLLRPTPPPYKLAEVKKPGGTIERVSPSNKVRERTVVEKKTGAQRTEQISVTGRVEIEEVKRKDGTKQITQYDLGREKKIQVVRKDGCVETTDVHYNRNGQPGARETIVCDSSGRAVSRTVVVQQNLIIHNTTVINNNTRVVNNNNVRYANNTTVVRTYYPSRYGYVYRPVVIAPIVFASYYDPYWYSPRGALVYHPFHYSWGWHEEPWYRRHAYYWTPYPVYAAPCFWITDWLVAGYVADRYATATSVDQTREEVRLAREEAEKARIAAEQARDAAEIAEAKAAQAQAEARAERAEARAAKAEAAEARAKELAAGKPNPNATPIDQQTKDALKDQIEQVIAEKKAFAEQSAKGGNPVPADVTGSLSNPKHIFPVSKTISVMRSEDSAPAGVLTAGDLLRVEPGQEKLLAEANENTPITMRVITSKGEDDSVRAGTLVAIPLKELQEFDNEFRAKIDLGLTEANNNKELFKKEAVN